MAREMESGVVSEMARKMARGVVSSSCASHRYTTRRHNCNGHVSYRPGVCAQEWPVGSGWQGLAGRKERELPESPWWYSGAQIRE